MSTEARPNTPDRRNEDGSTTITLKRCCNGCSRELGDITDAEVEAVINSRPLPDVRDECGCTGVPVTDSERCVTCRQVAEPPEVCCSAHGLVLCHACYRRTHFVEACDCALCSGSESRTDDPLIATDAAKLRILADWFDMRDDESPMARSREVQADLRRIAKRLDESPATDRTTSGPVVSVVAYAAEVARLTAENAWLRDWRRSAPGTLTAEMERIVAERGALSAVIDKVREWAMVNEIAALPLDWAGLGAILNPLAAGLAAPVGETPDEPEARR